MSMAGHDPGVTDFMAFLWAEMDAAPKAPS